MTVPDLLAAFDQQVAWCNQGAAPFTARVLERTRAWLASCAEARAALEAIDPNPLAAATALRWAGALHHLALLGREPWVVLWPPRGGAPGDAELDAAIRRAWEQEHAHVVAALARAPQTNEVQRSAVLLPGLLTIAQRTSLPIVLLEVGASAGLNLWCDRWRHEHGGWGWGPPDSPLTLRASWQGASPPEAPLAVARRAGCDASPIDLGVAGEALRLASFIWPDHPDRLTRLRAACRAAAHWSADEGVRVEPIAAAAFVERELAAASPGHTTVLMHSVVWQYIDGAQQAAIRAAIAAAGKRATAARPFAWLRMEPPKLDVTMELRCSLWPGGEDRLLARCHPHGAKVEWL